MVKSFTKKHVIVSYHKNSIFCNEDDILINKNYAILKRRNFFIYPQEKSVVGNSYKSY